MKKSILFLANSVEFNPETIINKGLGGSETAIIYIAKELARLGNDVVVICPCNAPGNYNGVLYQDIKESESYILGKNFDVMVVSRMLDAFKMNLPARLKIFWTQDAYDQPFLKDLGNKYIQNRIDKIFTVGKWQAETMMKHFNISSEKFFLSRNGINREFYENNKYKRNIGRLVYTSTPFRGLDVLLDVFPIIKTRIPFAELFIYSSMCVYGMSEDDNRKMYGKLYDKCNQPGIYLKGSIPQNILSDELKKSYLMVYPNHFTETSCIAAIEAQAAGLPVVTTESGGLSETVLHNKTGICISGNSKSRDYQDRFVKEVVHLIRYKDRWNEMSLTAHHRALENYSWDVIAREWDGELDREIKGTCTPSNTIFERSHNNIFNNKNVTITSKEGTSAQARRSDRKEDENPPHSPFIKGGGRGIMPVGKVELDNPPISKMDGIFVRSLDEKSRSTISLCMIVKNEEDYLPKCLQKMKPFVDEIIVVDTGSDDETVEIAKQYGARVYGHKWNDDFSEARNISLRHATGNWILALDADEVIAEKDMQRIRELISITDNTGFNLIQRNYENYAGFKGWMENKTDYIEGKDYAGYIDSPLIRLFKNRRGIRFSGRVHEIADISHLDGNNQIGNTDIVIHHYGKAKDKQQLDKKGDLYLSIGMKKIKDNPNNARAHFDLGIQCSEKGLFEDAVKYLKKAIDISPDYFEAYENLGCVYSSLDDYDHADFYLKKACEFCPQSKSAQYNLGRLYYLKNDFKMAETLYKKALEIDTDYVNAIKGMGTLCLDMKRFEESRIFFYKVLQRVKDAEIYNNLGCLEDKEGLYERAAFFFKKASEFDPHNQVIINNLKNVQKKLSKRRENPPKSPPLLAFAACRYGARKQWGGFHGSISLCMIVKNEEHNLAQCLNIVKDVVDEIIIVDTGSTDRSVEIAKSFGAKLFHHPWEGSFSKARNYSLKYATSEWILILDADEEMNKTDIPKLKEIASNNNYTAVSFLIKNKFKDSTQECYAKMIRLFKNFNGTYYEGTVHNRLRHTGKCLDSSLSVIHHGYNLSEEKMEEKFLRTTILLKDQIKQEPHNPVPHRYLGISYLDQGMYDEAVSESKRALELAENNGFNIKDFLVSYYVISAAYFEKGELKESETYALRAMGIDENYLDVFCILSFIYYNLKKYDNFLQTSDNYITLLDSIANHNEAINAYTYYTIGHKWKIHLLRGFYYLSSGQNEKGNAEIDKALKVSTAIEDCLRLIGKFYLDNNNLEKSEEIYKKLLNIKDTSVDAIIKMGHVKFKKGNLKEAIHFWEKAVNIEPSLFDIRLLICKINILQGNFEDVVSYCDQLLQLLNISRNITLESISDLANLFDIIGHKLKERRDTQAADTAFKICEDLKRVQPMDTVNVLTAN
ncbi:MAG: glycosyltransferase [Candidatus Scalinduaceae bacterium]